MKKILLISLLATGLCFSCRVNQRTVNRDAATRSTSDTALRNAPAALAYANPILAGDFPDPSVTKVNGVYWATATSAEWAPLFPLLRSENLIDWKVVDHVFPDKVPAWTDANFWAPEISYDKGKVYVYYTARKKGGSLCVGVASASNPLGPYRDHGPLVCQEAGSIDGFPIRDENGQLYLIWKEDGNSRKLPTPIWGQRMNEERTALLGEKFELFRNDAPWEGALVEGPCLFRRGEYYYTLYAGDGCCGTGCTYAVGVARAKKLTGPWEKYSGNPILAKNNTWKCPGHGSVVQDGQGRYFFLYHAYDVGSSVFTGRQGMLDEFTWTAQGWPQFRNNSPGGAAVTAEAQKARLGTYDFFDDFKSTALANTWQWPVGFNAKFTLDPTKAGFLVVNGQPDKIGAVLAQRTRLPAYTATVAVDPSTIQGENWSGLAAIGDADNAVGIAVGGGKVALWQVKGNQRKVLSEEKVPAQGSIQLRLIAKGGNQFRFAWSTDGQQWRALAHGTAEALDATYLPPWDRAVRVGLVARGPADSFTRFDWFRLSHEAI